MKSIDTLRKEIAKTEEVLRESIENLKINPDDYSAKLLVLSSENYLGDLLRELDLALLKESHHPSDKNDFSE
ncbi:MAG: hypothetical protein D6B25_17350 [Desulfobulbaceae bacterium]|nr:MAG: hypothetical protein D6B25_17350 [Desulfobulbaceae bacterium]